MKKMVEIRAKGMVQDILMNFKESKFTQTYSSAEFPVALLKEVVKIIRETSYIECDVIEDGAEVNLVIFWVGKKKILKANVIYVDFIKKQRAS